MQLLQETRNRGDNTMTENEDIPGIGGNVPTQDEERVELDDLVDQDLESGELPEPEYQTLRVEEIRRYIIKHSQKK